MISMLKLTRRVLAPACIIGLMLLAMPLACGTAESPEESAASPTAGNTATAATQRYGTPTEAASRNSSSQERATADPAARDGKRPAVAEPGDSTPGQSTPPAASPTEMAKANQVPGSTVDAPVPIPHQNPAPTDVPAAAPDVVASATLRPGTYEVGADLQPGIYAGRAGQGILSSCYWARLKGASGGLEDLLANDNAVGQFYVEVLPSDRFLETACNIVPLDALPPPAEKLTKIPAGTHIVGRDISPGMYQGEGGADILSSCYWARLGGLSGEADDLIANDNAVGQFFVDVAPTDKALAANCPMTLRGN